MKQNSHAGLKDWAALAAVWFFAENCCLGAEAGLRISAFAGASERAAGMTLRQASPALTQGIALICALVFATIIVVAVLVRMITATAMAHGGMGRRGVAPVATSISLFCSQALISSGVLSCFLAVLEIAQVAAFPSIGDWASYSLPVVSTLLLIAAGSFSLAKKEQELRVKIAVCEGNRRLLFDRSLVGTYKAALDGQILDCNFSYCQIFGYASREEAMGCSAGMDYFKPEDRGRFLEWLQAEKELSNFEQCLRRKDGGAAWILNSARLVRNNTGSELVIKGTIIDISSTRIELPAWLRLAGKKLVAVRKGLSAAFRLPVS